MSHVHRTDLGQSLDGDSVASLGEMDGYPGEIPVLISRAFALAEDNGLTRAALARELTYPLPRLRLLLGDAEATVRPHLWLV